MTQEDRLGLTVVTAGVALVCLFLLLVFGFGAFTAGIPERETPVTVDVRRGESSRRWRTAWRGTACCSTRACSACSR